VKGPSDSVKNISEREAKGVVPDWAGVREDALGEVKKGVEPPLLLEVELPIGVASCNIFSQSVNKYICIFFQCPGGQLGPNRQEMQFSEFIL